MLRFVLAAILAAPAFAQTTLAPSASKIWSQPLQLPAESAFVRLAPGSDDPRAEYAIHRRYTDTGFTEEWVTPHATSLLTFRLDGGLISEHHQNHFRKTGIDVTVDSTRTSVHTVITEQGKIKSDKTTPLTANIALREELNHLIVQAWRNGVRDEIFCQSLSPDGGLVGDFHIGFKLATDPTTLSDKYVYPAEFHTALSHGPYVVADMSLRGIAAIFFPHHFYLVYVSKPTGLEFIAYFGEDPKAPVFQFTPE
jgi:hypothetical protein